MSIRLSVIVITKNEEDCIAKCLKSVDFADEMIVLDSGSTDKTVSIARELGATVYETDWPGFGKQKQRALEYATGDWVLSLDADEFLDKGAKEIIFKAMQNQKVDAYELPRQLIFGEKVLKFTYLEHHVRFFRRDKANFNDRPVHESIIVNNEKRIFPLSLVIYHDCYRDWSDAINKMNIYSSLTSSMRIVNKMPANIFKAFFSSFWTFFRHYFMRKWFVDGSIGFAMAVWQAECSWYRYVKQLFPDKIKNV